MTHFQFKFSSKSFPYNSLLWQLFSLLVLPYYIITNIIIYLDYYLSKRAPWTSHITIIWEHVRNAGVPSHARP